MSPPAGSHFHPSLPSTEQKDFHVFHNFTQFLLCMCEISLRFSFYTYTHMKISIFFFQGKHLKFKCWIPACCRFGRCKSAWQQQPPAAGGLALSSLHISMLFGCHRAGKKMQYLFEPSLSTSNFHKECFSKYTCFLLGSVLT